PLQPCFSTARWAALSPTRCSTRPAIGEVRRGSRRDRGGMAMPILWRQRVMDPTLKSREVRASTQFLIAVRAAPFRVLRLTTTPSSNDRKHEVQYVNEDVFRLCCTNGLVRAGVCSNPCI